VSKAASNTLEKVSEEFETEVLGDLQEGRLQALAVLETARREATEAVSKMLEGSVKRAEAVKRQIIGAAELEVRNTQLKVLEKSVSEAFEVAVKEVSAKSGASRDTSFAALIKEGVDVIGQRAHIQCAPKDRTAVAAAIRRLKLPGAKLTVDDKGIDTIGGVVLLSPDGAIRFDNTFEARLERMRPALRKDVAGILTGS
jgi:V/A-type H+/Na+-transporting ATPase subunit E